jgi:hypothetical protein
MEAFCYNIESGLMIISTIHKLETKYCYQFMNLKPKPQN